VRGVNPSGSRILASALWTHLPPPAPGPAVSGGAAALLAAQEEAQAAAASSQQGGAAEALSEGATAVLVAGPYCLADDVAYDPLHELLTQLKACPPDLLVRELVLYLLSMRLLGASAPPSPPQQQKQTYTRHICCLQKTMRRGLREVVDTERGLGNEEREEEKACSSCGMTL
jgi:hypothetical protein